MTDLEDDLFDAAPGKTTKYGLRDDQRRYEFPPPPGVARPKPWLGWKRMTNEVAAFSDQRALQLWLERLTLLGLLKDEGLIFDEMAAVDFDAMPPDVLRAELAAWAEKARNAAGSDVGARRGTARHLMLEGYLNTGVITGHRRMRLQMESLLEAMEAHELDFLPGWSERRVWHPSGGGIVGTLDARVMCRRTGQVGVLDLKTQAKFWTFQEICGQQYGYDSAPWVWEGPLDDTGRWIRNPFFEGRWSHPLTWDGDDKPTGLLGQPGGEFEGKRVALLAHMPKDPGPDQLPVQIVEVDLEYGKRVLELASQVEELRSIGRSVAAGRRVGAYRVLQP